jgi:hypothetical protein
MVWWAELAIKLVKKDAKSRDMAVVLMELIMPPFQEIHAVIKLVKKDAKSRDMAVVLMVLIMPPFQEIHAKKTLLLVVAQAHIQIYLDAP